MAGATEEDISVAKAGVRQAKASHEASLRELETTKETNKVSLEQARRTLADLESSASIDITPSEQSVQAAETGLLNTKATYQHSIDKAKDTALAAIENKIAQSKTTLDTIISTLEDEDGKDLIGVTDISSKDHTKSYYNDALTLIPVAENERFKAAASNKDSEVLEVLDEVYELLENIFSSLKYCFKALEGSVTSSAFTQTKLDALKAGISLEQTTIATALAVIQSASHTLDSAILTYATSVSVAEDSLAQAKAAYDNTLIRARDALSTASVTGEQRETIGRSKVDATMEAWQVAQAQLSRTIAPVSKYDKTLYLARIRQAEAALSTVKRQIEDSIIRAPIDGTITKVNYEIGEQVGVGGRAMLAILGEDDFEIEVLISEADIAKINKDDTAEVTLDAYGDDIKFQGQVFFIEPAETVIQDVIYYKVNVNFDPGEQNIKSGMTANVLITTDEKKDILVIPNRAVVDRNGEGKIVRVLENNEVVEKSVSLGLRGDGGLVEVVSGLKENDNVITFINDK